MEQDNNISQPVPPAQTPAEPSMVPGAPVNPAPAETNTQETPAPVGSPANKKDKTLIIILGLIAIMAIVLGGLYFYAMNVSTKVNKQPTVQTTAPTAITSPVQTLENEEDQIENIDTGEPTQELETVSKDLQEL